jgi:N-acetylglucosaminyldiphosphoundecaprenol N-acetyl-beta-D-mannosaminyltransferase
VTTLDREYIDFLEITVTPLDVTSLCRFVEACLENGQIANLGAHNLHSVYLNQTDPKFRKFCDEADVLLIDGWPILAAANLIRRRLKKGKLNHRFRLGSVDWIPQVISLSGVKRVAVVGAKDFANRMFIKGLQAQAPNTEFLSFPGDPWRTARISSLAKNLKHISPDLILLGMGMPLQETVAMELRARSVEGIIATVGGAIDQMSGNQFQAPRWSGRFRIEWLLRLIHNPRRLARRYLAEPLELLVIILKKRYTSV